MADVATYTYVRPSALSGDGLALQTSGGAAANPRSFTGFLTVAEPAAVGLLAVAEVARSRYYQKPSPASLDSVVTGSRDRLRFESFSGCCGVYARLDVLPDGLDGEIVEHGTTNVDVNPPLQHALARVGGLDPLRLEVGPDDLAVSTLDGRVVERRVPLPGRWLRGFAEVQVAVEVGADQAWVRSGEERYQVRLVDGRAVSCTCQWWARHRGGRGPCKHALAVDLAGQPR